MPYKSEIPYGAYWYREALADDCKFQKRYMSLPFEVPDPAFRKTVGTLNSDEGINFSTAEGLVKLRPVVEGGSVTFGGQTHPADGNAAIIVATGKGERAEPRSESSHPPARFRHGARRSRVHAGGAYPGRTLRARSGGNDGRPDGRDQDPQSLRGERYPIFAPDRCLSSA